MLIGLLCLKNLTCVFRILLKTCVLSPFPHALFLLPWCPLITYFPSKSHESRCHMPPAAFGRVEGFHCIWKWELKHAHRVYRWRFYSQCCRIVSCATYHMEPQSRCHAEHPLAVYAHAGQVSTSRRAHLPGFLGIRITSREEIQT